MGGGLLLPPGRFLGFPKGHELPEKPLGGRGHVPREIEDPLLPVVGEGLVDEPHQKIGGNVEVPGDARLDFVVGLAAVLLVGGDGIVGEVQLASKLLLRDALPAPQIGQSFAKHGEALLSFAYIST